MPAKRRFSTLGGDPALDFLNTQPMGDAGLDERLTDLASLVAWCRQAGLINAAEARRLSRAGESRTTLATVRALRESFRAALRAELAGRPAWSGLARVANRALQRSPGLQRIRIRNGRVELESARRLASPAQLPGVIAMAVARFVASPDRAHARPCRDASCVLWFVDRTRNHSRHWCRMAACGARAKAKAYYWRRKRTAAATRSSRR